MKKETTKTGKLEDKIIQVCAECETASCWYGEFMCNDSMDAGLIFKTVKELRIKHLENEEDWSDEKMKEIYGDPALFGYAIDTAEQALLIAAGESDAKASFEALNGGGK